MRVKPPSEPVLKNCIYLVPCLDCTSVYIGQTKRQVQYRLDEHRRAAGKSTGSSTNNGLQLARHAQKKGHTFDWKNVEILKQETNLWKRVVLEAVAMECSENVISNPSHLLCDVWKNILRAERGKFSSRNKKVPYHL